MYNSSKQGFTLLELSIVLVIIGLIIGGITVGKDMIRSAEMNSIINDFSKYKTAINTFTLKYNDLPGDMSNAEDYWGTAHAVDATCFSTDSGGTATCNGDGNGIYNVTTRSDEKFRFWQHLGNAEIIPSRYSGVAGSGSPNDVILGGNIPEGRLTGTGWSINNRSVTTGTATRYAMPYDNFFYFGTKKTVANFNNNDPALTPGEAFSIDTKIDDGEPAQGKVVAEYWNDLCSAADDGGHANDDLEAHYKLDDTTVQCILIFRKLQ